MEVRFTYMDKVSSLFGFCNFQSLFNSLFKTDKFLMISLFSIITSFLSDILGLQTKAVAVLFVVILAELGIGIWAGMKRFRKFKLKKFERFGLKLLVYFLLLLVFAALKVHYCDDPEFYVYSAIHSFIVFYVMGVYLISIMRNASYIMGGSEEIDNLVEIFRLKIRKKTKEITGEKEEKEE